METKIIKPTKFQYISHLFSLIFFLLLIFLVIKSNNFNSILDWIVNIIIIFFSVFGLIDNFFQIIFAVPNFQYDNNSLQIRDTFTTKVFAMDKLEISFHNMSWIWGYIKFKDNNTSKIILRINLTKNQINEIKGIKG
mgnify:CR=1 FL=1